MKIRYTLIIEKPESHYLKVVLSGKRENGENEMSFFLPSWSPGSYLMREYGKNIRNFSALNEVGEHYFHQQTDKGTFQINWPKSSFNKESDSFEITYDIFCHELTVRTSHVDNTHAFVHGPSVFMGVLGHDLLEPELEIKLPNCFSKISTGLKDISNEREKFIYSAKNYDDLIDSPLEIGNHETDGFRVNGTDHELAFFGSTFQNKYNLKEDIQTIVEHISKTMKSMPYEKYTFITHFAPGIFGGLEHKNSTALQFSSKSMVDRKSYVKWLELVAHEYFHTWNVKRIRPKELGPFNYLVEAKTRMHWLTEGLTSFMDQLFVYRCKFVNEEDYLEMMKDNLNNYFAIPGRKFHSLEESSFNAWIKLYRPDENSNNSSISYYLKGGLVFFVLNILLVENGSSTNAFLDKLWNRFLENEDVGLEDHEVYKMIEELTCVSVRDEFVDMITTTTEIDFECFLKRMGVAVEYDNSEKAYLGFKPKFISDRLEIASVILDGPAAKSGLNAKDEILAIDGMRVLKDDFKDFSKFLLPGNVYNFTISRLGYLQVVKVLATKTPRIIKSLKVQDLDKMRKFLLSE